ncbi:hypothetical protein KFE80_06485 [bacterium SCSIO 12696]|nr:hypothetical protein KFE80_06485 [bacterium SCSIO 12696]
MEDKIVKLASLFSGALVFALSAAPFQAADASGGYGGSSRQNFPNPQTRQVDPAYERGKALVAGREKSYGSLRVCIDHAKTGEPSKVKSKHVKPYKKGAALSFANQLYNCESPDQKIIDVYARNDLAALIHYFNKRYKMKLQY